MGFIKRVWRGECRLAIAWGVFGASVVFFFIISFFFAVALHVGDAKAPVSSTEAKYGMKASEIIFLGINALCSAFVYIWALVGVWRSSAKVEKAPRIVSKIAAALLGIYFVVIPVGGVVLGTLTLLTLEKTGADLKEALDKTERALQGAKSEDSSGYEFGEPVRGIKADFSQDIIKKCNDYYDKSLVEQNISADENTEERKEYVEKCAAAAYSGQ